MRIRLERISILAMLAVLFGSCGGCSAVGDLLAAKELSVMTQSQSGPQLVSAIGSERATSGGGNKIVTHDGKIHFVWQDAAEEGYFNRARTLDTETGEWSEPFTLNKAKDNHARPNLMIDHAGYLHAVMSGHNSPVTHRQSVRPNDSSEWTEEKKIGDGTYPILACGPDDSLYVTMRSANHWNGVDLFVKRPGEIWKLQCKLVKRRADLKAYAAYHGGLAFSPDGTLHCVVDFYESRAAKGGRGVHQAVCYLRSRDNGVTWEKADGTPIDLPARPEQLDTLAQTELVKGNEGLTRPRALAQGSIVADDEGAPHILYISHLDEPGRIVHAWADADGVWQREKVMAAEEAHPDYRAIDCRGSLTRDADGNVYVLLGLHPLGKGWREGQPLRNLHFSTEEKRLVWLIRNARTGEWRTRPALPVGTDANEANVERPTGVNIPAADVLPPFGYFDGASRYRKRGEILQNNVFVVH